MSFLQKINIDFTGKTKYALIASILIILSGISSLIYKGGPSLSIDFTGGRKIQITVAEKYDNGEYKPETLTNKIDINKIRNGIPGSEIKAISGEHTIEIILPPLESTNYENEDTYGDAVDKILDEIPNSNIEMDEFIGPTIGAELRDDALMAIGIALLLITLYISFRFDLFFAYGSLAALVHDIIITLGIFSLLDKQIGLEIVAAFLTILGYSLNDTIVVFDRLRETKEKFSADPIDDIINKALNSTLSRTMITSLTTLMAVTTLYIFGEGDLKGFAFALIIGVFVGTYSSIFVASPVMKFFELRRKDNPEEDLEEGV